MADIIAIFEPFCIKFYSVKDKIAENIFEFDLFFYYNSDNKQTYNSSKYNIFLQKKYPNFFEGLYEKLENNQNFNIDQQQIDPKQLLYRAFEYATNSQELEKIYLSFDISFSPSLKNIIKHLVSNKYNTELLPDTAILAIKSFIINSNNTAPQTFLVLTNYNDKIIYSTIKYDGTEINLINVATLDNTAFEPFTIEAAKYLCQSVYRIYNIQASIPPQKDILYNYYKLLNKGNIFYKADKNTYILSLSVENSKERQIVRLNTDEIKNLAKNYAKNTIFSLNQTIKTDSNQKTIVWGNFFENEIVKNELKTITKNFLNTNYTEIFLNYKAPIPKSQTKETQKLSTENTLNIEKIIINNLKIGDKIKLSNFDSRPDKGWAYQHFEYIGDKRFIVIESTRSLKPGDIVETADDFWHIKTIIVLEVFRANKPYGRFQTREIQKIELILKKNNSISENITD